MSEYHTPVLLDESVSALISSPSGIYADATFGGGGHTSEILRRLSPEGRVVSFDRDSDAIANKPDDDRLMSRGASYLKEKPLSAVSNWCDETPRSARIPSIPSGYP